MHNNTKTHQYEAQIIPEIQILIWDSEYFALSSLFRLLHSKNPKGGNLTLCLKVCKYNSTVKLQHTTSQALIYLRKLKVSAMIKTTFRGLVLVWKIKF